MSLCAVASVLLATLVAQDANTSVAHAESLLAQGELGRARHILENVLRDDREHRAALMLLGRVHLAWPVIGRWRAWRLFERAAQLNLDDPQPRYWQMRVGLYLGSADGERLARDAIYEIWRIDPTYPMTWDAWRGLYRGEKHRRHALEILDAHAGDAFVDEQRALLLLELGRYAAADSMLTTLPQTDPAVLARRAQLRLERGDTMGLGFYRAAIARATDDTTNVLWDQVAAIASPEESQAYPGADPPMRRAFFEAFWARREPNLNTRVNERIVEHFERVRFARGTYPLLHPTALRHRSRLTRLLEDLDSRASLAAAQRMLAVESAPVAGRSALEDSVRAAGLGSHPSDFAGDDSLSIYRRYGYDARGLMYLRYGRPAKMWIDSQIEIWDYYLAGRWASIPFNRDGDVGFAPLSRRDVALVGAALRRDQTSVTADLAVRAWVASFRGHRPGEHLVYVGAQPDSGVAALWDPDWGEVARTTGVAPFVLAVPSGAYHIGVDVHRAGGLGRIRDSIEVADLSGEILRVSSMLVGVGSLADASRDGVARAMPAGLTVPTDTTLTLYAEIYNLAAVNGSARYEATYTFEALDADRVVTLRFTRAVPAGATTVERVELEPGRIPAGRYAIVLGVRDLVSPRRATSTRVDIEWQ